MVDKLKMIERFKVLFPSINLSKDRLNTLMVKLSKKLTEDASDDDIDEVLTDFNETYSYEDILKNDDRKRKSDADAKKKADEIARKKAGKTETDEDDDTDIDLPEDTPEWAKTLMKRNKSLEEKINGIESGAATKNKRELAKSAFDGSDILKNMKPEIRETWLNRFDLESETSFEDQTKAFETEFTDLTQAANNSQHYGGEAGSGTPPGDVDQKAVDSVVDKMKI